MALSIRFLLTLEFMVLELNSESSPFELLRLGSLGKLVTQIFNFLSNFVIA